jgi:hypothetical protein
MVRDHGVAALRHRLFVALLDQQPIFPPLSGGFSAHPHQGPVAVQFLAFEGEFERPLAVRRLGVRIKRDPGSAIPQHDGSAAIFALGNDPFELAIIERVVFDMDGEPLLPRVEARSLRHRPALQNAVELEAEIIMQSARGMLLDDKGEPLAGFFAGLDSARRLRRFPEIPFPSVFFEGHARPPKIRDPIKTHIV